jgi:hypothetical protein
MAISPPTGVTVFAYQVGFGDCLLVRFNYAGNKKRFVLIDFGSTKLPEGAPKTRMVDIANDIKAKCGKDGLVAVIATHRHQDHISGFASSAAGDSGAIIASLKPKLVIQPWTEDPDIPKNADAPAPKGVKAAKAATAKAAQTLLAMQDFAALAAGHTEKKGIRWASAAVKEQIAFLGQDGIKNPAAVKSLMAMGKAGKAEYLHHGKKSSLGALLGIKVHVLGPPTVKQHAEVTSQTRVNKDEFWHLRARALSTATQSHGRPVSLFPRAPTASQGQPPADVRWLSYRVRETIEAEMLSIVRDLDDALNNTSLILLFEFGGKKLLFPGDAQWENWEFALTRDDAADLLGDVNLYKVGHHGSLNATPKSMWNLFKNRSKAPKKGRLKSVLSTTFPNQHGHETSHTEVPRKTLVKALHEETDLDNTDELPKGTLCTETSL